MSEPHPWTCASCQSEQTDTFTCQDCGRARYGSWDIMVSEHVLEHIADGLSSPLDIQKAMNEREAYRNIRGGFQLPFIVQRIRMLTTDTTQLADKIAKAMSAPAMLRVFKEGKPPDLIQALTKWGPRTNAEQVEHKGEVITKHVVELHEGPPPKRDA